VIGLWLAKRFGRVFGEEMLVEAVGLNLEKVTMVWAWGALSSKVHFKFDKKTFSEEKIDISMTAEASKYA
jgi:hypothetical protein